MNERPAAYWTATRVVVWLGVIGLALVSARALSNYFRETERLIALPKWQSYQPVFEQHRKDREAVQLQYERWRREMEYARAGAGTNVAR